MKVLMLSTDENIFIDGSGSQERMKEYGGLVKELHIVIKSHNPSFNNQKLGNVFVYPASGYIKVLKIGAKIIARFSNTSTFQFLITSQDPFELGLIGYLLKKKFSLPLQLQIHTDFLSPYFGKESNINKFRVILGKLLLKKADGIRVVSERIKKSIVVNCKLKIENSAIAVLPIFVDVLKIKNSPVNTNLKQKYPGRFIVLMASRLTKEKNIGLAIEAIGEIVKKHPQTLLLIVGEGPELKKLKLLTIHYSLQTNVVFEPWTDDLSSYYKTADLFLLTSNYEGYGRTVVEATAADLPVIMTDVGVAVGSVVPVGDKKTLVERLASLIENSPEREKTLRDQQKVINFYVSKEDYLNRIKQSWFQCL